MDNERKAKWICNNSNCNRIFKNINRTSAIHGDSKSDKKIQDKQKTTIKEKSIEFHTPTTSNPLLSVQMDSAIQENIDNVTYRKKQTITANVPTSNLFDSLQTDFDEYEDEGNISSSTPQKINRSCPDVIVQSHLDHEALRIKLENLQQKYESAEQQIELLLSENFSLKKIIDQYKFKMCNLKSMCKSTEHPSASKNKSNSVKKSSRKNSNKNNDSFMEDIAHPSPPAITTKSQDNIKDSAPKRKLYLISTNQRNKVLDLALRTFQNEHQLCHFKLPHRGVLDTLKSIDEKTRSLSKEDYCVIMVGDKDFVKSQNYSELVKNIKNRLTTLNHTNIIICLPTFKCGRWTELFNRRIEMFNKLLYLDVQKHEYAFILDSNLHLTYDHQMFSAPQGAINNRGILNVLTDLKNLIEEIQTYSCEYNHQDSFQNVQMDNFFRV